ncbi:hypothetical protein Rs2_41503 [Raphanus sativus]|nr:hypothetical protein Rs2_41503 [Raphanus sativus]
MIDLCSVTHQFLSDPSSLAVSDEAQSRKPAIGGEAEKKGEDDFASSLKRDTYLLGRPNKSLGFFPFSLSTDQFDDSSPQPLLISSTLHHSTLVLLHDTTDKEKKTTKKVNPANGQTRRALSNINKNIIGAPVYPCAINKRPLSDHGH